MHLFSVPLRLQPLAHLRSALSLSPLPERRGFILPLSRLQLKCLLACETFFLDLSEEAFCHLVCLSPLHLQSFVDWFLFPVVCALLFPPQLSTTPEALIHSGPSTACSLIPCKYLLSDGENLWEVYFLKLDGNRIKRPPYLQIKGHGKTSEMSAFLKDVFELPIRVVLSASTNYHFPMCG